MCCRSLSTYEFAQFGLEFEMRGGGGGCVIYKRQSFIYGDP